ncbi:MAG: tetratricopeptide repeat protein [Betaproteobacteria bacterium]|jgi:putative thioredoxin
MDDATGAMAAVVAPAALENWRRHCHLPRKPWTPHAMTAASPAVHSLDVSAATFEAEVLAASHHKPVLVDFWAPWCGPCRVLKPVLEKLAASYGGRFRLAKVNSDDEPELSARYGVRGIPNVKAFSGGELADEFTGALPESQVRAFIDRLLPGPGELRRREARAQLAAGDATAALAGFEEAIALDPRNGAAQVDRAEALLALSRVVEAQAAVEALDPLTAADPCHAALLARIRLAVTPGADEATLRARLAANPANTQVLQQLAGVLVAAGRHEDALAQLLEAVRTARGEARDEARRAMVQVFDLLGRDDARVGEWRRRLASALN